MLILQKISDIEMTQIKLSWYPLIGVYSGFYFSRISN